MCRIVIRQKVIFFDKSWNVSSQHHLSAAKNGDGFCAFTFFSWNELSLFRNVTFSKCHFFEMSLFPSRVILWKKNEFSVPGPTFPHPTLPYHKFLESVPSWIEFISIPSNNNNNNTDWTEEKNERKKKKKWKKVLVLVWCFCPLVMQFENTAMKNGFSLLYFSEDKLLLRDRSKCLNFVNSPPPPPPCT